MVSEITIADHRVKSSSKSHFLCRASKNTSNVPLTSLMDKTNELKVKDWCGDLRSVIIWWHCCMEGIGYNHCHRSKHERTVSLLLSLSLINITSWQVTPSTSFCFQVVLSSTTATARGALCVLMRERLRAVYRASTFRMYWTTFESWKSLWKVTSDESRGSRRKLPSTRKRTARFDRCR